MHPCSVHAKTKPGIRGFSIIIVTPLPGHRLTKVVACVRLKFMKPFLSGHRVIFWLLLSLCVIVQSACAEWQREETSLAWRDETNVVWRFSFDPKKGKTFFDPVAVRGTTLTNFKPEDHPWHYG